MIDRGGEEDTQFNRNARSGRTINATAKAVSVAMVIPQPRRGEARAGPRAGR